MRKALLLLLLAGCSNDKPQPAPAPSEPKTPVAETRPVPPTDLIAFQAPAAWSKEKPATNMRQAQYRVPDKEKEHQDAELAIFKFKGSSSIEDNVQRWAAQMGASDPKQEILEGAKCRVTLVDLSGTYTGDLGGDPVPSARMLAAVVEASDGQWYFKLVGPAATVGDWREEFITLLKGAQK